MEANEELGCSKIKSEGIRLKAEHALLPLEDRLATYSLEDSVGISGAVLDILTYLKMKYSNRMLITGSTISVGSAGRRQSFPSSSFLRRSSSLSQVQTPTVPSKSTLSILYFVSMIV